MESQNIGLQAAKPKNKCDDNNCPFHGSLKCRGKVFTCTVLSSKMQKTVTVGWERRHFLRKYGRYEKRRSIVKAHNPSCINAQDGDIVKIMECRPLSKTKSFVIIEAIGKEKGFKEKIEAKEEAKFSDNKKEAKAEDKKSDS